MPVLYSSLDWFVSLCIPPRNVVSDECFQAKKEGTTPNKVLLLILDVIISMCQTRSR